jgi:2-desacetyl-2-hydroxyethyl bacteriochlorophyllide A dehydrogenase
MKAAMFLAPGRLELQDLPLPDVGPGEARVRVLGCGVCGTDAHIYEGHIVNARPPVVLGHEICGQVDETGPLVRGLAPGETVVVDPFVACGECPECRSGERRFCRRETFIGYHRNGGFAQFSSVPAVNLYRLPPSLSVESGILAETLATVVAGLHRLAPRPGRRFLLLGAGTVGLLWAQLLRRALPACLIQTEIVPERLERARALGADLAFSPLAEEPEAAVRRLCPDGVDYLIDATGSTEAVAQALPLLAPGATFLSFGICPSKERLPLSLNWFYRRQVTFITSRRPPGELPRALDLLSRGAVDSSGLVTGRCPLSDLEECFRRFTAAKDQELKMMIDPWS